MSYISNITTNIESRIQTLLGSDYKKLSYVFNIEENKFTGNTKRYGVIAESASETQGLVGGLTVTHDFIIKLTDTYSKGALNQLSDVGKQEATIRLEDNALSIVTDLQANKSAIETNILIINNYTKSSVKFIEDSKVAYLEFYISIQYYK